jgi:hypothetical protein
MKSGAVRHDGIYRHFWARGPHPHEDGSVLKVGTAIDLTEHKPAQEALQLVTEELRRSMLT